MVDCTSTGDRLNVEHGGSLVMKDCRDFDVEAHQCSVGVDGQLQAFLCTFEGSGSCGVWAAGSSTELVDCVICKNGDDGLRVDTGTAMLRGSTISQNPKPGVRRRWRQGHGGEGRGGQATDHFQGEYGGIASSGGIHRHPAGEDRDAIKRFSR